MQTMDSYNDSRMSKSVDEFFTVVKSPSAAAWKAHTEPKLMLEDISDEELKEIVNYSLINQFKHGDANTVVEREASMERFYNIYSRERPLTIPPNMNGLVGSRVFWQGNSETLMSDFLTVKDKNINRFTHRPSIGLVPRSLMAQRLYDQMELSKKEVQTGCSKTNNIDCGRELLAQNKCHKEETTTVNRQRGVQNKKNVSSRVWSRVRSRVMKLIRRLSCFNGKSVEE